MISYRARTRLVSNAQLVVVQRQTAAACRGYEHSGADQLMPDMSGRPGIPRPRGDAGGLSENVVPTVSNFAELRDDSARLRCSAAYRIAVPWRAL